MFEPRVIEPTDQDLVELLATAGMGWVLHNTSGHRPGSRDIPHAWRWNRDKVRIMVFLGGSGHEANVEFDPLGDPASAEELRKRLTDRGMNVEGWDLSTSAGRRSMCEHAAVLLKQELADKPQSAPEPQEQEQDDAG